MHSLFGPPHQLDEDILLSRKERDAKTVADLINDDERIFEWEIIKGYFGDRQRIFDSVSVMEIARRVHREVSRLPIGLEYEVSVEVYAHDRYFQFILTTKPEGKDFFSPVYIAITRSVNFRFESGVGVFPVKQGRS